LAAAFAGILALLAYLDCGLGSFMGALAGINYF
jgi:hypothetical protein